MAGEDVEVVDHRDAAQVEQVLGLAEVAGTSSLPVIDMGQGVLNLGALAEFGAAVGRVLGRAELGQQPLIGVDLDAATAGAGGALGPQRAGLADLGGKLDLAAWDERHGDAVGAGQQALVEVEAERGLGEPGAVADRERLAEHLQVRVAVGDQAARQIGPVDVQLAKGDLLGVQVGGDLVGDLGLWEVGGVTPTAGTSSVSRSVRTWRL